MASRRARQRADSKPWQRQPLPEPAIDWQALAADRAQREQQQQPRAGRLIPSPELTYEQAPLGS